ncbi:MAG: glycoside hydrolase family 13 protein [Propionibacteriales bacterium]|nr:glycoside hydrolase family 13 protein [Propionibacteriales bacterium]
MHDSVPTSSPPRRDDDHAWWQTAVVYQVYIRSFADGNGDGIGDIRGLQEKLPYLADLGIDAVWINPWYPSPMEDGGYDVADYRDIDPMFGTLEEAEQLIRECHDLGLKVLLDIVPNHTSSQHPWFQAALSGDRAARERYIFRPGKGVHGDEPPNDWQSNFGGPAWTRSMNADGTAGDWYLHLFAPGQPDLEWNNPEVHGEFEDVLRFWFDRDVDGFRIDVAHGLAKAHGLPDTGPRPPGVQHNDVSPLWDQDHVHEIYRAWRKVGDSYDPPRIFVAEAWVRSNERLALYVRPDELQTAFQFDFLRAPWRADVLRRVINDALDTAKTVDAPSTWVLSNHDVVRHVSRYARSQPSHLVESEWERTRWDTERCDLVAGTRRARAAILLMLSLPGVTYLYQGEELGLPEVEDIASDLRQDPTWEQSGHTDPGRDGCRVPLPWSGTEPPFGFSPEGATAAPWLPQPASWAPIAAERQEGDDQSMLSLYRDALQLRREYLEGLTPPTWLDSPDRTLAFRRGNVQCWVNTGPSDVPLPNGQVLLASGPGPENGVLPTDTAIWLVDQ